MTDTKKLIEQARKLAETQKEQAIVEQAIEVSLSPASPSNITPQDAFNETWDAIKSVGEKANRHGVTNITDLTTGDAIYNYVEQGKIYFMAVDHNKQYLMQGLCISKNATQATFVGYSWNTSVKHTNTVWATAEKGRTSGDTLSFNGVSVDDLKNDDNALANVALVKSLSGIPAGTFSEKSDKLVGNKPGATTETAFIGNDYLGVQKYGAGAKNNVSLGERATGDISIATLATGGIFIGSHTSGTIQIGSTTPNTDGHQRKIYDGAKSATFEEIIDAAKSTGKSKKIITLTGVLNDGDLEFDKIPLFKPKSFKNGGTPEEYITLLQTGIDKISFTFMRDNKEQNVFFNNNLFGFDKSSFNGTGFTIIGETMQELALGFKSIFSNSDETSFEAMLHSFMSGETIAENKYHALVPGLSKYQQQQSYMLYGGVEVDTKVTHFVVKIAKSYYNENPATDAIDVFVDAYQEMTGYAIISEELYNFIHNKVTF